MSNPQERGWGPAGLAKTVRVPCPGIQLNVRPEVAPLFVALVARLDAARRAHGLSPLTSSGGYNLRPIRGYEAKYAATKNPDYLSNHSWGLAADFNAGTNPMGSPLRTDMPPETKAIAASLGFTHGAEWSRPDPQHLEFLGTPADAARLVAGLTKKEDELSAEFEADARKDLASKQKQLDALMILDRDVRGDLAIKGRVLNALDKDLRADLAKKASDIDALRVGVSQIIELLNRNAGVTK